MTEINQAKAEKYLRTMGASWFISYSYYTYIDSSHANWNKVPETFSTRHNCFNATTRYHRYLWQLVLNMNPDSLKTNKIGLSATDIKSMTQKLLSSNN